jgi:hypothetical protein
MSPTRKRAKASKRKERDDGDDLVDDDRGKKSAERGSPRYGMHRANSAQHSQMVQHAAVDQADAVLLLPMAEVMVEMVLPTTSSDVAL